MTSAARTLYAFIQSRFRRSNTISDIRDFLGAWDEIPHPRNTVAVTLRQTRFGNINSSDSPGSYAAPALRPWHPRVRAIARARDPGARHMCRARPRFCALDLVFRRSWGPWRLDFVCVERVYARVLRRLRSGSPSPGPT